MVFFTCNHCGESLKKPVVDKHYQWKTCRGQTPFLTCVDCLKDFRGDEYRDHTKCVSELEKYSAKGFVAKADKNKGAKKQEIWIEVIQNLQIKPGLDSSIKHALERIGSNSNVPRKKPKFLNFIKSSMKMSPNNSEKLWNVIEMGLNDYEKILAEKKAKQQQQTTSDAGTNVLQTDEKISTTENGTSNGTNGKLKKNDQNGTSDDTTDDQPKKKKKKDNVGQSEEQKLTTENGTCDETNDPPKKKKKKDTVVQPEETKVVTENGTSDAKNGKPKKKKKTGSNQVVVENNNTSGFDWKIQISKVVTKKSEINIEKLKAKVLKKYAAKMNVNEITHKIDKTFQKHIKKMKTISVENDIVKFVKT